MSCNKANAFAKASTPTFTFSIKDPSVDLTEALNVYVTFEQGASLKITKTGNDIEYTERTVKCWLTQTESLSLSTGSLYVQINWTYEDAAGNIKRGSTDTGMISVTTQLLNELLDETAPEEVTGDG